MFCTTELFLLMTIFILNEHSLIFLQITLQEIELSKKNYYQSFFVDNLNNMKNTWDGINTLSINGKKKKKLNLLFLHCSPGTMLRTGGESVIPPSFLPFSPNADPGPRLLH